MELVRGDRTCCWQVPRSVLSIPSGYVRSVRAYIAEYYAGMQALRESHAQTIRGTRSDGHCVFLVPHPGEFALKIPYAIFKYHIISPVTSGSYLDKDVSVGLLDCHVSVDGGGRSQLLADGLRVARHDLTVLLPILLASQPGAARRRRAGHGGGRRLLLDVVRRLVKLLELRAGIVLRLRKSVRKKAKLYIRS